MPSPVIGLCPCHCTCSSWRRGSRSTRATCPPRAAGSTGTGGGSISWTRRSGAPRRRRWRRSGIAPRATPALARDHAARALAHATAPRQPLALLAAHRTLGVLATDAGDRAAAEEHLAAALALADACRAPYERALTLLAAAELLADATGARGRRTTWRRFAPSASRWEAPVRP